MLFVAEAARDLKFLSLAFCYLFGQHFLDLFLPKRGMEDADALREFLEEKLGFPLQQYAF